MSVSWFTDSGEQPVWVAALRAYCLGVRRAGAIATAGVLAAGLVAFRQGNQALSQRMMRTRVLVQGATVALMVGTSGAVLRCLVRGVMSVV